MNEISNFESKSLLRYIEQKSSDFCGYCKSTRRAKSKSKKDCDNLNNTCNLNLDNKNETTVSKSVNFGVIAHLISFEIFNCFLDFGWSRSGKYLFKPIMEETCCPQYTIRLDVNKFKISKSQKKILRTMFNFLKFNKRPTKVFSEEDFVTNKKSNLLPKKKEENVNLKNKNLPNTPHTLKKKTLRRIRAEEKLKSKGIHIEDYKLKRQQKEKLRQRTFESFFEDDVENKWKHKFEIHFVSINSNEFLKTYYESYLLFKKYQESVHEDFDNTEEGFKRFLVSSPFITEKTENIDENVPISPKIVGGTIIKSNKPLLGSYYQQYILDGKIIAIGVIDILPRCLSSKYFFYDPDYKFLSLGTFSALNEIRFTKALACERPEIHYYYMGFYVYNCPKMRYKGRFCPSELLCDKTHKWVDLTECKKILALNNGKFMPFCNTFDSKLIEETIDIDDIKCVVDFNVALPFRDFQKQFLTPPKMINDLKIFAKHAGLLAKDVLLIYTP